MPEKAREQRISLVVDGTKLSLKVKPEEESLYRRAGETYNSRVNLYRAKYPRGAKGGEEDDFPRLMAAIDMALQLEVCRSRQDPRPVEEELARLCQELNALLESAE